MERSPSAVPTGLEFFFFFIAFPPVMLFDDFAALCLPIPAAERRHIDS